LPAFWCDHNERALQVTRAPVVNKLYILDRLSATIV
jgi:hypothetical protein